MAYKRGHKNLKELIAPSKISFRDSEGVRGKGNCQVHQDMKLNVKNAENVENQPGVGGEHQVSTFVKC